MDQQILKMNLWNYGLILSIYPLLILSNQFEYILKREEGKRLNATFKIVPYCGIRMCIDKCLQNSGCRSVNYYSKSLACELNFVGHSFYPSLLQSAVDFEYFHIATEHLEENCSVQNVECVALHTSEKKCIRSSSKMVAPENVALGKTVYSSSVYDGNYVDHDVKYIVDGNSGKAFGICGSTYNEMKPWILIDLGQVYQIRKLNVVVFNLGYPDTTCAFYDIRIGLTTNTSEMTLCNTDSQYVSKIVECQQCIVGQFVHFQLNNNVNCHLHFCEVEIFAVKHML